MKKVLIGSGLMLLLVTNMVFAASPVGYWAQRDDNTGKVLSVIQVWRDKQGTYDGRIYKVTNVVVDGKRQMPTDKCTTCGGKLAQKPFLCMQVIYDMKTAKDYPNTWQGGKAYDPKSDNTYHAKMWLSNNDKILNVRGYVMMPLFGRTQAWTRVPKPAMSNRVCERSVENSYSLS